MIGVFDSGIGGLSILKALRGELPHEDFIYIADSGHAPYGERDEAHVVARTHAIASYLVAQGIKALVVACNTATAAAIDQLRHTYPDLPVIGVEPALRPAVALSRTRRIGVMATRGTLGSSRFKLLLKCLVGPADFVLQPCDGLAAAIELDQISRIEESCARHTGMMGDFGQAPGQIDTVVLGCTHYPFASGTLRALLGPEVTLIDTGTAVARQTRLRLQAVDALASTTQPRPGTQLVLLSTGDATGLQAAARRWIEPSAVATHLALP